MRRRLVTLLTVALLTIPAGVAQAKGPTHARLDNAAQLHRAAPGDRVRIAWTMSGPAQLPLPAGIEHLRVPRIGVYVEVRGAAGGEATVAGHPTAAGARGLPGGPYAADVTVPPGGIESLVIEVRPRPAARSLPIAPAAVPIDNPILPAGGDAAATPPGGLIVALLGAFGLLIATVAVRTQRRRPA